MFLLKLYLELVTLLAYLLDQAIELLEVTHLCLLLGDLCGLLIDLCLEAVVCFLKLAE
jgi:hypothetical protein